MIFKNLSKIIPYHLKEEQKDLRKIGLNCINKAVKAVRPEKLIKRSIEVKNNELIIQKEIFNLNDFGDIYIIGGGKASSEMALTFENLLKTYTYPIKKGIVNIPEGLELTKPLEKSSIELNYASHPIPNEIGKKGVQKMFKIVRKAQENDLIICLISGGGSALLPYPKDPISLDELQHVNTLLLESGASIEEINAVRKHLSEIKGGNLVKTLYNSSNATLITLIISDVIGDRLDSIASGPTVPDSTTYQDAIEILKKYTIWESTLISVKNTLKKGVSNVELENPKQGDICFKKVYNYLIGSAKDAVDEIKHYLQEKDFCPLYFSNTISGEAKEFGRYLFSIITQHKEEMKKKGITNLALIGSGELTVTIHGDGVGGRNQEMLLSFLENIIDRSIDFSFLVIGSNLDGIEGNSEAMGGLIDNKVLSQARDSNLNLNSYLSNNDSNSFFKKMGIELLTGPTGCNVNDLLICLISENKIGA
jgi:glycerate-2-kinase